MLLVVSGGQILVLNIVDFTLILVLLLTLFFFFQFYFDSGWISVGS